RSRSSTFVTPDRDSFVVNETATQVTGHRQKTNADDRKKERQQTNFWVAQGGRANPQIDSVNCHNHEIQNHVPVSCGLARVIAANIGVIDKAGHSRKQRCDDSEEHCVKGSAQKIWRIWTGETGQIDEKAQEEEPDRKMDQHGMD